MIFILILFLQSFGIFGVLISLSVIIELSDIKLLDKGKLRRQGLI